MKKNAKRNRCTISDWPEVIEQAKDAVAYDPDTGKFTWKLRTTNAVKIGDEAGTCDTRGYIVIYINNVKHRAHRLAWELINGQIPQGMTIDHANLDKSDNRLSNLRLATSQQNGRNRRCQSKSVCGFKGVSFNKMKNNRPWQTVITIGIRKRKSLGYYATPEEAHEVWARAAVKHHGEFARLK